MHKQVAPFVPAVRDIVNAVVSSVEFLAFVEKPPIHASWIVGVVDRWKLPVVKPVLVTKAHALCYCLARLPVLAVDMASSLALDGLQPFQGLFRPPPFDKLVVPAAPAKAWYHLAVAVRMVLPHLSCAFTRMIDGSPGRKHEAECACLAAGWHAREPYPCLLVPFGVLHYRVVEGPLHAVCHNARSGIDKSIYVAFFIEAGSPAHLLCRPLRVVGYLRDSLFELYPGFRCLFIVEARCQR